MKAAQPFYGDDLAGTQSVTGGIQRRLFAGEQRTRYNLYQAAYEAA